MYRYWNESETDAAFEGREPLMADKSKWCACHVLHEQLVALDVLTKN